VQSLSRIELTSSNLISNSLKFTNTGSITLRTRLIQPDSPAALTDGDESPLSQSGILPSADDSNPVSDLEKGRDDDEIGQSPGPKRKVKMAIIRIEVQDTGVGLRPADMEEYVHEIPGCDNELIK
jgi:signal transduction histidine kinase